eukprot:COSAG02_NODE_16086_length_1114_cov_1.811823_2_plen_228_part_00
MTAASPLAFASLKLNRTAKTSTNRLADVHCTTRTTVGNFSSACKAVVRLSAHFCQPILNRPPKLAAAAARDALKPRRRWRRRLNALQISAATNSRCVALSILAHARWRSSVRAAHHNTLGCPIASQCIQLPRARPYHASVMTAASSGTFAEHELYCSAKPRTKTLAHQVRATATAEGNRVCTVDSRITLCTHLDVASFRRPAKLLAGLTRSCGERRRWRWRGWRRGP